MVKWFISSRISWWEINATILHYQVKNSKRHPPKNNKIVENNLKATKLITRKKSTRNRSTHSMNAAWAFSTMHHKLPMRHFAKVASQTSFLYLSNSNSNSHQNSNYFQKKIQTKPCKQIWKQTKKREKKSIKISPASGVSISSLQASNQHIEHLLHCSSSASFKSFFRVRSCAESTRVLSIIWICSTRAD